MAETSSTTTTAVTPEPNPQPGLFENAVGCSIVTGRLGIRRRVRTNRIQTDADDAMVHVAKDIIDCPEHKAIIQHDNAVKLWMKSRALPAAFRMGIFLVPIGLIEEVADYLNAAATARAKLVLKFIEAYEAAKTEAETRLGSLYDALDYPPAAAVAAKFTMEHRFITFDTPTKLQSISTVLFQQEKAKVEQQWQDARDACMVVLRGTLQELVDHIVERLEPKDDGKPKTFHKSTLDKLTDFLEVFDARNIADDVALAALVGKAKTAMHGVDAKKLRSMPDSAAALKKAMTGIKSECDKLVKDAPNRLVSLDD